MFLVFLSFIGRGEEGGGMGGVGITVFFHKETGTGRSYQSDIRLSLLVQML